MKSRDNADHISIVRRIICATRDFVGKQEETIEETLKARAFSLFPEDLGHTIDEVRGL